MWFQQERRKAIFGCLVTLTLIVLVIFIVKKYAIKIDGAEELSEFFPEGLPTSEAQEQALDWISRDTRSSELVIVDKRRLLERFVLAVMFYATGGEDWDYPESCNFGTFGTVKWLSKKDTCLWTRLSCTDEENVASINIVSGGAIGSIPTEIALLTSLDSVFFGFNSMTGTIPTQLAELQKLTSLFLSSNHFNGTIPTELALLTNLVHLEIGKTNLTGSIPTEFGRLTNLESLVLGFNHLTGTIPTEIGLLKKMALFRMGSNNMTGTIPTELGALPDLEWIEIDKNDLSGSVPTEFVEFIAEWSGLECFLGGNPKLDGIPETCKNTAPEY